MTFVNPATLTDDELLEDLEAAKRMSADVLSSDEVPYSYKQELARHVKDLIQEQEDRNSIVFPLEAFGITNFF